MPVDAPVDPGAVFEFQVCGEGTMHYETCPSCGSDELEAVD